MEESVTYQEIIRKGVRRTLLRLGERKFETPPDASVREALEAIEDISELEALAVRWLDVDSWQELLLTKNGRPVHR
jgi:hypothetical protein